MRFNVFEKEKESNRRNEAPQFHNKALIFDMVSILFIAIFLIQSNQMKVHLTHFAYESSIMENMINHNLECGV